VVDVAYVTRRALHLLEQAGHQALGLIARHKPNCPDLIQKNERYNLLSGRENRR
jgi:hypothetical protein